MVVAQDGRQGLLLGEEIGHVGRVLGHAVRAPWDRKDHTRITHLRRHRTQVRSALGIVGWCEGSPRRHRSGASKAHRGRTDRSLHRRGAPLLQDSAGRAAGSSREPYRSAGRGDDGKSFVLGGVAVVVEISRAAVAAAELGRHRIAAHQGGAGSAWTRRCREHRRRRHGAPRALGGRGRSPRTDGAGSGSGSRDRPDAGSGNRRGQRGQSSGPLRP